MGPLLRVNTTMKAISTWWLSWNLTIPKPGPRRGQTPWKIYCLRPGRGRKVGIVRIDICEGIHSYLAVEALLTSRTLYGDDQDEAVARLRRHACHYMDFGDRWFICCFHILDQTQAITWGIPHEVSFTAPC